MQADLTSGRSSRQYIETAPNRMLPAATLPERLAEGWGRVEERIRERPVVALVIAVTAGLLAGRLLRGWLKERWPREEAEERA